MINETSFKGPALFCAQNCTKSGNVTKQLGMLRYAKTQSSQREIVA